MKKVVMVSKFKNEKDGTVSLGVRVPTSSPKVLRRMNMKPGRTAFITLVFNPSVIEQHKIEQGDIIPYSDTDDGFTLHFEERIRHPSKAM